MGKIPAILSLVGQRQGRSSAQVMGSVASYWAAWTIWEPPWVREGWREEGTEANGVLEVSI